MSNKIINLSFCIFAAINIFYISFILLLCKDRNIKILSMIYVIICFSIWIIFLVFFRKRILEVYKVFDKNIDSIVSGNKDIKFEFEGDDLISKFQYKLKRLYECMKDSNTKVEKEKDDIQKLISDISHQIKTPMANLQLYNETLLGGSLDKQKEKEFLLLMKNQLVKLDFLIESFIKMSRLENGVIQIRIKEANLYETIACALGNIFLKAEEKNINVQVLCDTELIVKHDPKWTSEAIFNVLDNAVKYTNYGGNIKIEVINLEMFVKIQISDDGKGIRKENICRIFERFYREDDVSEISGIGVGLYLSREITSKEGGYINVKSEEGKGSVFSIFLLK